MGGQFGNFGNDVVDSGPPPPKKSWFCWIFDLHQKRNPKKFRQPRLPFLSLRNFLSIKWFVLCSCKLFSRERERVLERETLKERKTDWLVDWQWRPTTSPRPTLSFKISPHPRSERKANYLPTTRTYCLLETLIFSFSFLDCCFSDLSFWGGLISCFFMYYVCMYI